MFLPSGKQYFSVKRYCFQKQLFANVLQKSCSENFGKYMRHLRNAASEMSHALLLICTRWKHGCKRKSKFIKVNIRRRRKTVMTSATTSSDELNSFHQTKKRNVAGKLLLENWVCNEPGNVFHWQSQVFSQHLVVCLKLKVVFIIKNEMISTTHKIGINWQQ